MKEKLLETLKKGWSHFGKVKFHYFNETPTTLCGKYKLEELPSLLSSNSLSEEDCCKKCLEEYKKLCSQ
jgi:hypothetical protein